MVRRGSTVRVRQRASRNPCRAPTLRNPNRKRLGRAGTRGLLPALLAAPAIAPSLAFQGEPRASTSSAYERIRGMTLIGILVLIAIIWLLVVLLGGLPT